MIDRSITETMNSIQELLGDLLSWRSASAEIKEAFVKEMIDKEYGYDPLFSAWLWFLAGWNTRPVRDWVAELPARIVAMCKKRGWSMHWTHRGAYLHLESSELIEAIRGKNGDPASEAGDVLLVLMSITEYAGIPFSRVLELAEKKLCDLETKPHYKGEEFTPHPPEPSHE